MNTRDHKVQRVLLEIINTEQETYQDDEEAFSNIINDTLTRVLEELLDEINVTSETIMHSFFILLRNKKSQNKLVITIKYHVKKYVINSVQTMIK